MKRSCMVIIAWFSVAAAWAGDPVTLPLVPIADAMVREQAPTLNYGGGGAVAVAGAASVNSTGAPRGRFDALVKFDASTVVPALDATFGGHGWRITSIELAMSEVAAPNNALFPRGVGDVAVRWFSSDDWTEGTGTPNAPPVGVGTELTWNYFQTLSATASEEELGAFNSTGTNDWARCTLTQQPALLNDLKAAAALTLRLAPLTDTLGFTFNSRSFASSEFRPALLITAEALPFVRGDMNCDGVLNNFDIHAFLLALIDAPAYTAEFPFCDRNRADINQSGQFDGFDIDPFVECIVSLGCP